jgi:hypothetical protein
MAEKKSYKKPVPKEKYESPKIEKIKVSKRHELQVQAYTLD